MLISMISHFKWKELHERIEGESGPDWAKKLHSILFAYRLRKQASTSSHLE